MYLNLDRIWTKSGPNLDQIWNRAKTVWTNFGNHPVVLSIMVQKKHIVAKDVVGLLLGEVESTKNTHIVTKDVVGLLLGDSKNDSLTKMKTY